MRMAKITSRGVRLFGYMIFGWGILSTATDVVSRFQFFFPQNMGIVLANGAILMIGLVAITVATALRGLGERLDKIENVRSASGETSRSDAGNER